LNELKQTPGEQSKAIARLRKKIQKLEQRCAEAEEALGAIQSGSVDALVVYTDEGEKIYTIQGAETTYRMMIESINEGAATLIEDGTILYCNQHFAEMLATPLELIIATSIHQYVANDQKAAFSSLLSRGIKENCREESVLIRRNGEHLPVMLSFNNFSSNQTPGVCMVATDLTAIQQAEQVIRKNALQAETMADVTHALVEASMDEAAIMSIVNRSAIQLIGDACIFRMLSENHQALRTAKYDHPDPHIRQLLAEILTDRDLPADKGICGSVVKSGEAMRLSNLHPGTPKQAIRAEFPGLADQLDIHALLAVPVRTSEKTIGTLELVRLSKENPYTLDEQHLAARFADHMAIALINARLYNDLQNSLHLEQAMRLQLIQAEKLSALNRMMATVVHEINNPVQTIKNCIYLAESEAQPDSAQLDYLAMASSEINRITKLVFSMREIYRQPKHQELETLELSKLLADVLVLLETHMQHQKVTGQQGPSRDLLWVNAVPDQLKQVFINLGLNAIEAMQPDGGILTISTITDEESNQVGVVVTDTGCGVAPDDLTKIFEPFYTTKEAGSGLGLAICYEIIQQHGGRITVESQPGRGSTFTVWLPLLTGPGESEK
jgi:PAS domain S-box-containing protein